MKNKGKKENSDSKDFSQCKQCPLIQQIIKSSLLNEEFLVQLKEKFEQLKQEGKL